MSRIPIRLRLTLLFAGTMLVVLGVVGLFVYSRFRAELDRAIDLNLRTEAAALVPLIERSKEGLAAAVRSSLFEGHESVVEVLDGSGSVVAATPSLGDRPLLSHQQLVAGLAHRAFLTREPSGTLSEGSRLLAVPVRIAGSEHGVLVVGATLDERDTALSNLATLLAIVGPLALLIASVAAYALASAALRPVESLRNRAAAVTAAEPGQRLPVPAAHDEIRRLAQTLNSMLERLERSLAREKSFVANASHELRTPLATLKAELELALRRPRSADELRLTVASAEEEADRLAGLADDLLVLARADEGALPLRLVDIDVQALLGRLAARYQGRVNVARAAAQQLDIRGDADRLEQALADLLDNARRYGGGAPTLRATRVIGGMELHVLDDGPGFPPEFLDEAFERFTRADPGQGGHGAGLGLSIVREIARAHGGEAHAANRPQGGADVWIFIPAEQSP